MKTGEIVAEKLGRRFRVYRTKPHSEGGDRPPQARAPDGDLGGP